MAQRITGFPYTSLFLFRLQESTGNIDTMLGAMQSPPHPGVVVDKDLDLVRKSVKRELILLSLIEISLDLDNKFVEREANIVS